RALDWGAVEYLAKPVRMTALAEKVRASLATDSAAKATATANDTAGTFGDMSVGGGPGMRRIYEMLPRVVASDSTVMILGESGTGKEVIARAVHEHGKRKNGPFVQVNCAALVDSLLEAELFGVVKGAATDVSERPGKFELAHGGTLLLDEIGDMAAATQSKVLRVLQERVLQRVGSNKDISVDVRIVAATHRDLEAMVAQNAFRQDLYYRLNVIRIELPPLRERLGDLELYTNFFLKRLSERTGRKVTNLTADALKVLQSHPWPGNVRELENVLERAMVLSSGSVLDFEDLPPLSASQRSDGGLAYRLPEEGISLEVLEKDLIVQAMDRSGGNKSAAARLLGLTRRTLGYRLEKHGLGNAEDSEKEEP
nr:sigma-54-dependent Fis family transcriptional regulator [bacterium]